MLSLVNRGQRVPAQHPLRLNQELTEVTLKELSPLFEQMSSEVSRPASPPERLLQASRLRALDTLRSVGMFCEQLDYDRLFRWLLDLNWDEPSCAHSSFSRNRGRLLEHEVAGEFLRTVVAAARTLRLTSEEPFMGDGTLLAAWAALKRLRPRAKSPALECLRMIPAIRAWTSTARGAQTRPTSRGLIRKRGWRRRAPAKRLGFAPAKAC
jgi:transposase